MMEAYLGKLSVFKTLPKAELKRVAAASEVRRFRKGEGIFEENHPAEFVWFVRRGWVYLTKLTPQGSVATIFAMTPDEAICGVSAFDHGTYSAGAHAATDTQMIKIPAAVFSALIDHYPKFARQVLLTCCTRMRHMAEAISLSQSPVEKRIAHVLLRLRATFGQIVPITHHELARMAGTRWETSIRTLSSMKRKGWVRSSRGKITILAPERLRATLNHEALR